MRKQLLKLCLSAVMLLAGTAAWALDKDANGVYQIGTAEDLKAFADLVNAGELDASAVLTADIDYGTESTMIGMDMPDGNTYWFNGLFDGQGHTVKLNMFPTMNGGALFQNVGILGRVTRVKTTGTITTEFKFAAGIAGWNRGVISRCATDVTVKSSIPGDGTHGGIVGVAQRNSMVADCVSAMTIATNTTNMCGGLVGWSEGKSVIQNCLNINDFQFADESGSAVTSRNFSNYVSQGFGLYYVKAFGDTTGGTQVTEDDVKNGKVCYLLNTDQSKIIWTQNIGTDAYPMPFGDHGQVYCSANTKCDGTTEVEGATYSNTPAGGTPTKHTLKAGFCSVCKGTTTGRRYEGASTHNQDYTGYYDYEYVERDAKGWYLVRTAEDMLWIANTEALNNEYAHIHIMNDIDYSEYGFWLNASNWYSGVVDGHNHKITVNIVGGGELTGLFPQLAGDVRNLWIDGEMSSSRTFAGSIFGETQDDDARGNGHATMNNILSTVTITTTVAGDATTGGLGGRATKRCYMYNCIFAGKLVGEASSMNGGLVGWSSVATHMANCAQLGIYECGQDGCNTFSRNPGYLTLEGPIYYLNALGDTPADAIQVTEDEVKSGKLAFMLNTGQEGLMWTQKLGTDEFPFPFNDHGEVFAIPSEGFRCDGTPMGNTTYSNDGSSVNIPDHKYNKGFCDVCDNYDPEYLQPNGDGFYELATARDVAWFAHKVVDGGNTRINGLLTADIDFADENNHMRSIGTLAQPYRGHFDGQMHTISNLNLEENVNGVGMFGTIAGGLVVENMTMDETCSVTGSAYVGGFVGFSITETGEALLKNLGNEGSVTCLVGANAGGIHGCSMGSSVHYTLENCWCTGSVDGPLENAQLSGWLGSNAIVNNCWSTSPVTGVRADDNQFAARSSADFTNCYSDRAGAEGATKVTAEQVESGELTYMLNGKQWGEPTWYQTLPDELHPVLLNTHGQVYFYNNEYGSVNNETDFQTLRQLIKDTEGAWIDGEDFVAEDALIEAYRTLIEGVDGTTTMKELYDYVNSMSGQKSALEKSANAYNKYIARAAELREILASDDSFQGEDREILAAYLDGEEGPSEVYPNGAYYYVIDYHTLNASQIAAELDFMNELYVAAKKFGYIEGTEITDLLVNPKFVEDFKVGWEGVLGSGKTSAELTSPDGETTATYVGAEAWNKTFDMHQTLHGMKEGVYLLKMNASQRASSSLNTKSLNYTASMYLNDNLTYLPAAIETKIAAEDAIDQVTANITGATADLTVTDEGGNVEYYYLHGQLSMAVAANADRSPVYMVAQVGEDGDLTVGIKNPGAKKGSDWVGFANTKLTYCGALDSETASAAIDEALNGQLERAATMLDEYEAFIDENYAIQPNYSAEMQAELGALVQEAADAADNAAKMEVIKKFSVLFEEIYECKQAYVTLYQNSNLIEDVVGMLSAELSEDETTALFNLTSDMRIAFMDGTFSTEQALNPEGMESVMAYVPEQDADGVYQIKDKYNMAYFAALVNSLAPASKGVMCNDIDMLNVAFVGIGTPNSKYNGTFDGQGHTISNLKVDGYQYVGLFGQVTDCTIKRLVLDKTCELTGDAFIGIVGGTNGACTVNLDQLGFEGTATGVNQNISGIIGCNMGSTATFKVSNCYVTGTISGGRESATITGWSGGSQSSFTNCWSTGTVTGCDAAGQFYRNTSTVLSNCWDIYGEQTSISKLTDAMLKDGSFTYNLNGSSSENPIWYQTLGTDTIPQLFKGSTVYYYAGEYTNDKPVIELNSYAYNIDTNSDADKVTVKYTLNSPAKAAQIDFYAGETKVYTEELAGDDLTQGDHAVEVPNSKLPEAGTAMTFGITVESIGVLESAPVGESMKFWSPYGMAINNNPESSTFGVALVLESATHPSAKGYISDQRENNQGVYAFTPQLESIPASDGIPGFTGGADLSKDRATKTIRISEDGRLFIGNQSGVGSPLYEANLEDLNQPWTPVFTGGTLNEESGITYIGEEMQVARMLTFDVVGKGDDLKIYTLEGDKTGMEQFVQENYYSHIYNLGKKTQWDGLPSANYEPLTVNHWTIAPNPVNIMSDKRGGMWYIQYRSAPTATVPAMKHYNAADKEDYSNISRSMPGGGLAMSPDGNLIVFPSASSTVTMNSIDYVPMENGMISMTGVDLIPTTHDGSQLTAIGLDYANNIWVASNGTETLTRYVAPHALPGNKVTTPSNSRANFKVGETKGDGIQKVETEGTNEIYTLDGVKVEKAKKGVNIVNGKKVLVK